MNDEQLIPNESTFDTPTFEILSDGEAIDPGYQVYSITVMKEVNRIPGAKLLIRDGEASEKDFPVSNASHFEPGKEIEIKAGFDGDNRTIFKGLLIKHRIQVKGNGQTLLKVECKDQSVKMTVGRKNKYFEESTDSDIISEVLATYGLDGEVEDTVPQHKEVVQHHSTDWDFVLSRAEMNGKLLIVDDGQVDVKAPKTEGEPELSLAFGGNIVDFDAEMDARTQWKAVAGLSWDYANQQLFESETSSVEFSENGNLPGSTLAEVINLDKFEVRHSGHVQAEELQAWTDACMLKSRLAKIRGRAKFVGCPEIKPGMLVELGGVGDRFNGKVYVTGIRHELFQGNCFTNVQFGLDPDWCYQKEEVIDAPAAGLLPAVNGLQIGKVVQLQDDPDGEDRILVKLPIVDNEAKGVWARVCTLDAGADRGSFFRPEIDDEVVVGFLNDDPRDAIVLGMLHSSAKPAPIPGSDDNHEKGFVTRSQMRMWFDDDKKIITIETPAGNSLVFSEEDTAITMTDQNGNNLTMDPNGITIKSAADINIEAPGNINIKASGNLSMEGVNVEGKAQAQMKMEGQAAAEFSAGGNTTVKGAVVMIN